MTGYARGISLATARWLFLVAAAWNLAAAAPALLAPAFHARMFYTDAAAISTAVARLNTQGMWVFVLLFGLGYAIVARDPRKNHGIVLIAAIGKTYVGISWLLAWNAGHLTALPVVGALGDLAFAAAFARFLLAQRRDRG